MGSPDDFLSAGDEATLLRIARQALEAYVRRGETPGLDAFTLSPPLREPHGAFVTLRWRGELRGCIGYTRSLEPLALAVRDNAINAAARDPRFRPVGPGELGDIRIEVSALKPGETPGSPFILVNDIAEIVLGRDGLYLEHAGTRGGGLLLPQVPIEQGWPIEQFLAAVCRKAGADDDAWKSADCQLYRFSAQVFGEQAPSAG